MCSAWAQALTNENVSSKSDSMIFMATSTQPITPDNRNIAQSFSQQVGDPPIRRRRGMEQCGVLYECVR
jgi:hypothetical protein